MRLLYSPTVVQDVLKLEKIFLVDIVLTVQQQSWLCQDVMCLSYEGPSHLNSLVPLDRCTLMPCSSKELVFLSLEAAQSAKGAVFD